jgi:hypothetical protein
MSKYPQAYLDASPQIQNDIITIGTVIYYNGLKFVFQEQNNTELSALKDEKDTYECKLRQLRDEFQSQVESSRQSLQSEQEIYKVKLQQAREEFKEQMEKSNKSVESTYRSLMTTSLEDTKSSIHRSYEHLIQGMNMQIADLRDRVRTSDDALSKAVIDATSVIRQNYDNLVHNLKSQLSFSQDRISSLEIQNTEALSISNKLDSLVGKKTTIDNAAKGDFGESIVHAQIMNTFPKSVIEDTSGITARGDMLWKLNKDQFRALVEVKNVQTVRNSDIIKFERDLKMNSTDGICNCALFVSLKTEYIPSKGQLHFEFINNIPIIYVSNVFFAPEILKLALNILYSIFCTISSAISSDNRTDFHAISQFVSFVHKRFEKSAKNIQQMKSSMDTLSNCISSEEKSLHETLTQCNVLQQQFDFIDTTSSECVTTSSRKQLLVDAVSSFVTENKRFPTTAEVVQVNPNIKSSFFRGDLSMNSIRALVPQ